jgi:S1-C subfamily serine protease
MFKIELKKLRAYALVTVLAVLGTVALIPAKPVVAQGRSLPDFTDLVEQVGPSVVNIRTVERARNTGTAPGRRMRKCRNSSGDSSGSQCRVYPASRRVRTGRSNLRRNSRAASAPVSYSRRMAS